MEVQGKLRPKWEMDNFFCSHRCLLTEVMVVRGASGVLAPARSGCIPSCVFAASYVRLYPSSARLCTPAPSLCLPLTTSERTFHLPTEWAGSELFFLSSNDEEYRSQCPRAPQPEPS